MNYSSQAFRHVTNGGRLRYDVFTRLPESIDEILRDAGDREPLD